MGAEFSILGAVGTDFPTSREARFASALDAVVSLGRKIMVEKRRLRGSENIRRQGLQGVINRLSEDKLERVKRHVKNLALRAELAEREIEQRLIDQIAPMPDLEDTVSLEDDLIDIANYAHIMVLMLRGAW